MAIGHVPFIPMGHSNSDRIIQLVQLSMYKSLCGCKTYFGFYTPYCTECILLLNIKSETKKKKKTQPLNQMFPSFLLFFV